MVHGGSCAPPHLARPCDDGAEHLSRGSLRGVEEDCCPFQEGSPNQVSRNQEGSPCQEGCRGEGDTCEEGDPSQGGKARRQEGGAGEERSTSDPSQEDPSQGRHASEEGDPSQACVGARIEEGPSSQDNGDQDNGDQDNSGKACKVDGSQGACQEDRKDCKARRIGC